VNSLAHQPPQTVRANGIELCYEIFGDADAEPMLLIMGLGAQMIQWDDNFCRQLADRGFRVIRFDNRDIGKSSQLSGGTRLTPFELLKLRLLNIPVSAPYKLSDMAQDTIADGCAEDQIGASCGRVDGRHDRPGNRNHIP
jgi:pimeloyl-ACP methyl ester carboxylesterase